VKPGSTIGYNSLLSVTVALNCRSKVGRFDGCHPRYVHLDRRLETGGFVARVMVVEDNPELLSLFTHVLARSGHAVTPCRDAIRALEQVRDSVPDLVITDFDMPPGMTGRQLVRALKDDPATTNVPIMMVTGSVSAINEAERSDLACYLAKPVLPADLVRHVHEVLDRGCGT
jgi:CheY-like chemotaxis protein